MKKSTIQSINIQLVCVQNGINYDYVFHGRENYYLTWKRHYLLKRLLVLQLQEFNRD
jgi:hypothetical protein